MSRFGDGPETFEPFAVNSDDNSVADAFAKEYERHFARKTKVGSVLFDEDEIADNGN